MKHRHEIDGLRAIAVIPVIFFHAGFDSFKGGYIGVDVFFVISGYLITNIIIFELNKNNFSITDFYERRARRILPCLFFVMLCCLPFAWLWLSPSHYKDFSQSLIATSAFSSNILFWMESGYFETASEFKPLVHTWSLAIEEQYYALYPLLMILLWKVKKEFILPTMIILGITSLTAAHWYSYRNPSASYFLLPTRGWELILGSLISLFSYNDSQLLKSIKNHKLVSEILGFIGITLIIYSVFTFDKTTPFPSAYTLIPTIGASLIIIFSTQYTFVGRILALKPIVGLGLISYGIYLWHQPLLAFARHRSLLEPSFELLFLLLVASIFLAYLSWRFIEKPFRKKTLISKRTIFTLAIVGSLSFSFVGLLGHYTDGFQNRFNNKYLSLSLTKDDGRHPTCQEEPIDLSGQHICIIGDLSKPPTIAIVGDSHSTRISKRLSEILSSQEKSALVYAQSWGVPLIDMGTDWPVKKSRENRAYYLAAFSDIGNNQDIRSVVLFAEWANYTSGVRWGDTKPSYYTDSFSQEKSIKENTNVFTRSINRTLEYLSNNNKSVVVIGSIPEYNLHLVDYLAKSNRFNKNTTIPEHYTVNEQRYKDRNSEVLTAISGINNFPNTAYINPFDLYCPDNECDYIDGHRLLYINDGNHLTYFGSIRLAEELARLLIPSHPSSRRNI